MSIQEAIPLEDSPHLAQVLGPEVLSKLPTVGHDRVRHTALRTIGRRLQRHHYVPDVVLAGVYALWFNTQSKTSASPLLMGAISYVVAALSETSLCLDAANALRDLCDANRTALAPHIGAFGEIYARLSGIPVRELYWLVPMAI